jgi:DNA repair photolyase
MVHELADAGEPVWVSVNPWVPGVTDIISVARGVGSTIPIRVAPLNVNSPK